MREGVVYRRGIISWPIVKSLEKRERERSNVQSCTNNDGNNVDLVGRRTHPCNIPFLSVLPPRFSPSSSALSLSSRNGRWNPMGSIIRRIPRLGCACTWFHDCCPVPGNLPHTWSKLPSSSSYYSLFLLLYIYSYLSLWTTRGYFHFSFTFVALVVLSKIFEYIHLLLLS